MVCYPLERAGVTVQFAGFLFRFRLDAVDAEPAGLVQVFVIEPEHQ
jgi:hypothetical protein